MSRLIVLVSLLAVACSSSTDDVPDTLVPAETDVPPQCVPQVNIAVTAATFAPAHCGVTTCLPYAVQGNGCVTVESLELTPVGGRFQVVRDWADGAEVPVDGSLAFSVQYTSGPAATPAALALQVAQMPDPLQFNFEGPAAQTACLSVEGALNFEVDLFGEVSKKISVCNFGPPQMLISSVAFEGDPDKTHWRHEPDLPAYAVPENECLQLEVFYSGTEDGLNAEMVFEYSGPVPGQLRVPAWGGPPKSRLEFAPGTAASPAAVNDRFVIYNVGNGPLDLTSVTLERTGGAEEVLGVTTIAPFGLHHVVLEAVDAPATLRIEYTDFANNDAVLTADVLPAPVTPPSLTAACPSVRAGDAMVLTAGHKADGSWYLVEKPADSRLVINGVTTGATLRFLPDVPGAYVVGLGGATLAIEAAP